MIFPLTIKKESSVSYPAVPLPAEVKYEAPPVDNSRSRIENSVLKNPGPRCGDSSITSHAIGEQPAMRSLQNARNIAGLIGSAKSRTDYNITICPGVRSFS
jgi:hypothetical protein